MASALTKPVTTEREDEAHQRAETQVACADLQQAAEQRRCQQVLQAVLAHRGHHQQRHGAGGGGDHPGAHRRRRSPRRCRTMHTGRPADRPGDDGEAMASGISAGATTRPDSRSPRRLENQFCLIVCSIGLSRAKAPPCRPWAVGSDTRRDFWFEWFSCRWAIRADSSVRLPHDRQSQDDARGTALWRPGSRVMGITGSVAERVAGRVAFGGASLAASACLDDRQSSARARPDR